MCPSKNPCVLGVLIALGLTESVLSELQMGLAAYWSFDNHLADPVGEWHARPEFDPAEFADGKHGQSLVIGADQPLVRVIDTTAAGLDVGDDEDLTISAWVRPRQLGQGSFISTGGKQGWSVSYPGFLDDQGILIAQPYAHASKHVAIHAGEPMMEETFLSWHHLVVIQDGTEDVMSMYVDGLRTNLTDSTDAHLRLGWPGDRRLTFGSTAGEGFIVTRQPFQWEGQIDEVAVWKRMLTESEIDELYQGGEGLPLSAALPDADADGLPTIWEERYQLDANTPNAQVDTDGDGLSNEEEIRLGTNPTAVDTDVDGLPDGEELPLDAHPLVADTDRDGLNDGRERSVGTNPKIADTDRDGFVDGDEVAFRMDPLVPEPAPFQTGTLPSLAYGLVAHWEFNGDLSDRLGNFNGMAKGDVSFVSAKHSQGVLLSKPRESSVEILSESNEAFEFTENSFSISAWIDARGSAEGRGNLAQVVEYGGSQSWYALLQHWNFDDEENGFVSDDYSILLETGIWPLPGSHVSDQSAAFPEIEFAPSIHVPGGSRHRFAHTSLTHVVVVYDAISKSTLNYVNGRIRASAPATQAIRSAVAPGLRIQAGPLLDFQLDDLAVWNRALTSKEILKLFQSDQSVRALTDPVDTDNDGMEDSWEERFGLVVGIDDGGLDSDLDGLTNKLEFARSLNPNSSDTDDDTLVDIEEPGSGIWQSEKDRGTSGRNADSDGDGLPDRVENPALPYSGDNQSGTDPNIADTDGDGAGDLTEVMAASDPADPESLPVARWNVRVVGRSERFVRPNENIQDFGEEDAFALLEGEEEASVESTWEEPVLNWSTRSDLGGSIQTVEPFPHQPFMSTRVPFAVEAIGSLYVGDPEVRTMAVWVRSGVLSIDGKVVRRFANDFSGQLEPRLISLQLEPGFHDVRLVTWTTNLAAVLSVGISGPIGEIDEMDDGHFILMPSANPQSELLDRDQDGLFDAQEVAFFPGDLTQFSSNRDWDIDGIPDGAEFRDGSNPVSPVNSLVALFTFDQTNSAGANSAYRGSDAVSGTAIDGQLTSGAESIVGGGALALSSEPGQSAWLEGALPTQSSFTLSLWINPTSPDGSAQILVSRGSSPNEAPFALFLLEGNVFWLATDTSGSMRLLSSPETLESGKDYHLTIVHQASPMSTILYLDGQESVRSDWPEDRIWLDRDEPLFIGGVPSNNGFNGRLDQLSLYNRALTPNEVHQLFSRPTDLIADGRANPTTPLKTFSIDIRAGLPELNWASQPASHYEIEYSENLRRNTFQPIAEIEAQGITTTYLDNDPERLKAKGFYRIRLKN